MKIRYIFALTIVTIAATFLVAQPLSARDTNGDLEQFRSKLAAYYADLSEVYPYVAGVVPANLSDTFAETERKLAEAQRAISELTDEDLTLLREAISQNPAWWDLPTIIRLSFGPEAQGLQATAQGAQGDAVSLLSHPACPPPGLVGVFTGPQGHIEQEFTLKIVAKAFEIAAAPAKATSLAAEAVHTLIQEGANAVAVAVWAIAEGVVLADELVVLGLEEGQ